MSNILIYSSTIFLTIMYFQTSYNPWPIGCSTEVVLGGKKNRFRLVRLSTRGWTEQLSINRAIFLSWLWNWRSSFLTHSWSSALIIPLFFCWRYLHARFSTCLKLCGIAYLQIMSISNFSPVTHTSISHSSETILLFLPPVHGSPNKWLVLLGRHW